MNAAGGTMRTGPAPDGGFQLTVVVPLDAPSYASAPRPIDREAQPAPAR